MIPSPHNVAIDSRNVTKGSLFFALKGERVDGHAFLQDAANNGATAAVVHENYRGACFGMELRRVPDVLAALQEMARKALEKRQSKVIGITGSIGKTTVKEFTATLLKRNFKIFASPLSYNSQRTLPLSILAADGDEDYLILEMGMSEKGELANLVSIAPPDLALITTVSPQHTCNFPDGLAGICREKAAIFSHPKTKLGLLHLDMPHFNRAAQTGNCLKKTFSTCSNRADFYLDDSLCFQVNGEPPYQIPITLPNKVHYHNFLAAVAIARSLNLSWQQIQQAARLIKLPPMRFEKVVKQGIVFINDAFNANPDSMKGALENLPKPEKGGKTIAVLSEMDALGMYTEAGHKQVAEIALRQADLLLCLGPHCESMCSIWKQEKRPATLFANRAEMEEALIEQVKPGDVVLLKGARSYALEEILNKF